MRDDQAGQLAMIVISAFPTATFPAGTLELFRENLLPLPFEQAHSRIEMFVMTPRAFAPNLGELLVACGVDSTEARELLSRAKREGLPLKIDRAEPSGWTLSTPRLPPGIELDDVTPKAIAFANGPPDDVPPPLPRRGESGQEMVRLLAERFRGTKRTAEKPS